MSINEKELNDKNDIVGWPTGTERENCYLKWHHVTESKSKMRGGP